MFFFTWVIPLIRLGFRKNLELEDLGEVSPALKASHTYLKIKEKLHETDRKATSMFRIYWNLCSSKLLFTFTLYGAGQVCHFLAAVSFVSCKSLKYFILYLICLSLLKTLIFF